VKKRTWEVSLDQETKKPRSGAALEDLEWSSSQPRWRSRFGTSLALKPFDHA
jgi:hypothetical protein